MRVGSFVGLFLSLAQLRRRGFNDLVFVGFWLLVMRWPGIFVLRAEEHLAVWLGRLYNGSSDTQFGTLSVKKNVVGMRGLENMLHKMKYLNCIYLTSFGKLKTPLYKKPGPSTSVCKFLLTLAGWVAGFYLPCSDTSRYVHVMLDS